MQMMKTTTEILFFHVVARLLHLIIILLFICLSVSFLSQKSVSRAQDEVSHYYLLLCIAQYITKDHVQFLRVITGTNSQKT